MLDKIQYITIDENGIAGQDARTKEWYCKEVPFKDADDLRIKINNINKVLNEFNKSEQKKERIQKKQTKKEEPDKVRM